MLVKICGVTNVADALKAEELGADLLGLNFVPYSKRRISESRAKEIIGSLAGRAKPVGVFADSDRKELARITRTVGLKMIQLHGKENPFYVNHLAGELPDCPFLKAFAFTGPGSLDAMLDFSARLEQGDRLFAFLLEGPWGGGTGRTFDWSQLAQILTSDRYEPIRKKLFLAGGLNSQNVAEAVRIVHPAGVDVATGVETSPGIKDAAEVEKFIRQAQAVT